MKWELRHTEAGDELVDELLDPDGLVVFRSVIHRFETDANSFFVDGGRLMAALNRDDDDYADDYRD